MCPSNNESRICDQLVVHLTESEAPRIVFGAQCNRAMYQHIIRNRLSTSECRWKGLDELKRRMCLVRPDGSSWGPAFDQVAFSRLENALKSRRKNLVRVGAIGPRSGSWAPWVDGLLHPDWSGNAALISEDIGWALLDDLERNRELMRGTGTGPGQGRRGNGHEVHGQHLEEEEFEDIHHLRAMSPPPSAMLAPSVVLGPDDSASVAPDLAARRRDGSPALHRPVAEIEGDIVVCARMLFQFSATMDRLQYEEKHADDSPDMLRRRRERWDLVQMLIDLEKELDSSWIRNLFGMDAGLLAGENSMPRGLVGSLWLHFLGGSEERFVMDVMEREHSVDVESMVAHSLTSLSALQLGGTEPSTGA